MNKLFYVGCYSHQTNWWARFLVTAVDDTAAMAEAISSLSRDWKAKSCIFVCLTPDDVYKEI